MKVHNTAYMHDGTVREFDCEYGEQSAKAREMGGYWRMETYAGGFSMGELHYVPG